MLQERRVRLLIKRDDLIHPTVSGNKWRKLKYNLLEAQAQGCHHLVTFGGAFSNHIHAIAAAGATFGFHTTGIIRGESTTPLNPTLQDATKFGMQLLYADRSMYRDKATVLDHFAASLPDQYYLVPEGGTNHLALRGSGELVTEVIDQLADTTPTHWCVSCGTGGTISGMIQALANRQEVIGFSALKRRFYDAKHPRAAGSQYGSAF